LCWVFSRFGLCELFAQAVFEPQILLISASQVARITGKSHWCLAVLFCFWGRLLLTLLRLALNLRSSCLHLLSIWDYTYAVSYPTFIWP
jgi:hypothetical protein